ncbi:sialate O-acetylesterase [Flavobacterium sp. WC2509]|uniref:sialate O-acetylesterase n=1 Tax=Flavobacterium sp. WC2509 TaxID=3461406 RepID=UPI004043DF11
MKIRIKIFFSLFLLGSFYNVQAIELPKVISDNMILQRDKAVIIWGKAKPYENITVKFKKQSKKTKADAQGKWQLALDPLAASDIPSLMEINGGEESITLKNILIGDVWICSGQSNMEYPLDRSLNKYTAPEKGVDAATEELAELKSKSNKIRYIFAEKQRTNGDLKSVGWVTSANDSILRKLSALGYFFAKEIHAELNVPIGIISTSWGGTRIEEWTPKTAYLNSKVFKDSILEKDSFKIDGMVPGQKFESMFLPIVPFAVKGMLWYQGESNCMIEDQQTYPEKMKLLVETYRSLLKNPAMPFYYVQIAPYAYSKRTKDKVKHTEEQLALFREAQTKCLSSIDNSGMIVISDLVDNVSNIHPSYKWEVAHRLALVALNKTYGKKVVCSGPTYKSFKVDKNKIILSFDNIAGGLKSNDGQPLNWFTIAGADGNFVVAKAEIEGEKIVVRSDEVKNPVAVRFAWNESAIPNLCNQAGLPAVPFRTNN